MRQAGAAALISFATPGEGNAVSATSVADNEVAVTDRDTIALFLCGDVMTGRAIDQVLPHPGSPWICERFTASALTYLQLAEEAHGPITTPIGFSGVWGEALAELAARSPDLRIVNLETSITTSEACTDKGISYRMNPANVPCLAAAGIDCCTLANNHVLDWGRAGLRETLKTLDDAGIRRAGAGRNDGEAWAPAVLQVPGKGRILVFAAGCETSGIPRDWDAGPGRPGVNLLPDLSAASLADIAGQVRAQRRPGDRVILSIHWGGNWGYDIPRAHSDFARGLIDEAGVDLVHGHSSHHAKGIEVYRNKLILYGCGDFLNDYEGIRGYEQYRDDLVVMYFPRLAPTSGALLSCEMVPLQIRKFRLNRASSRDVRWLRDVLDRECGKLGAGIELLPDDSLALRWQ